VLDAAYALFRDHHRFAQRIASIEKDLLGTHRITLDEGLVQNPNLRLSDSIAAMRSECLRLQFEIRQSPPHRFAQENLSGDVDLAITLMPSAVRTRTGRHRSDRA
jgi:hypothetical protein